jgi:hypothetical protein
MLHKNDYTCIAFWQDGKTRKWKYVHTLSGFAAFINLKHPQWNYFNVYDRRTGRFLKRFYPGNIISKFLKE